MDKLDEQIRDYYQTQQMSGERLQSLLEKTPGQRRYVGPAMFAMAAVMVVTLVASMLYQHMLGREQTRLVLREAAMNHATKPELDVEATQMSQLQAKLQKLPFMLAMPSDRNYGDLSLLGGRYCTIRGNLAAHIRFADPQGGKQLSLFMTSDSTDLGGIGDDAATLLGTSVRLWRENGVFYAIAESL